MTTPIRRILIANRGEIARRIIRTAQRMGIETVAVYSQADADAPYVREADFAIALPGNTSAETYLDVTLIVDAALRSGADAVHPGYGFGSENPEYAQGIEAAGLTWIGPTPHSIRQMAAKIEAKKLAAEADVPLVPGAELPEDLDDAQLRARAAEVGYPLLIKASAGGGGKGMRTVATESELLPAITAARREALSSFGDPTVFAERYLQPARHIEVQVFGDTHGRVVHLFERECSIQRRHQKIVEESPAAKLEPSVAERMYVAAAALARVIGYVGAGTVEFLVADTDHGQEFFFLEMNTRLQVEHPVTEAITGIDLVEWQIRIARGEPLPRQQGEITRSGHAIEVRVYAEDPAHGYLPNTGTVCEFSFGDGVRLDSGVEPGSIVTAYYDPMLAKVVAHAPDRLTAAQVMSRHLGAARVCGLVTNRESLAAICSSPAFLAGDTMTDFLDRYPEVLDPAVPEQVIDRHLVAAVVHAAGEHDVPTGWRNVVAAAQIDRFATLDGRLARTLATRWIRTGLSVSVHADSEDPYAASGRDLGIIEVRRTAGTLGDRIEILHDGVLTTCEVSRHGDLVCIGDGTHTTQWRLLPRFADPGIDAGARGPSTPVPGTVTVVEVAVGDTVATGQCLVVLEAMKMEHRIVADTGGVVREVLVEVGQSVDAHTVVVVLDDVNGD